MTSKFAPETSKVLAYWSSGIPELEVKFEHCKYQNRTPKVARKAFNIGEAWNPVVAMVIKLLGSYRGALVAKSYCKESNMSDTNWLIFHHI